MKNQKNQKRTEKKPSHLSGRSPGSLKMIATMGGVGFIASILIVVTFQITLPVIERNKAELLERSIFEVLPEATRKVVYKVTDTGELVPLQGKDERAFKIYAGYNDELQLVGVAIEAKGGGFQDVIQIIYGYDPLREVIIGMKVLESKETPGLGDRIETDPQFKMNFKALDVRLTSDKKRLLHPLTLVKRGTKKENWQIEAITGATVSSRAIANILRHSTEEVIPLIVKNLNQLQGRD